MWALPASASGIALRAYDVRLQCPVRAISERVKSCKSLSSSCPRVNGPAHSVGRVSVPRAFPGSSASASTVSTATNKENQWWKKQSELWIDVHSAEDFEREVSTGPQSLVFVGGLLSDVFQDGMHSPPEQTLRSLCWWASDCIVRWDLALSLWRCVDRLPLRSCMRAWL